MFPASLFPPPSAVGASVLNSLLRREPWASDRLARHAGKTVRFVAGAGEMGFSVQANGLVQASDSAIVPDVTLAIAPDRLAQLPGVLRSADPDELAALMHVQGDASLARVVSDLARELRWDIEHDLARLVGDAAALRLLGGARAFLGQARQAGKRLGGNAGEYLSEESRLLLGRPAFLEWRLRLQATQQRLAELEHSVARLDHRGVSAANRKSAC